MVGETLFITLTIEILSYVSENKQLMKYRHISHKRHHKCLYSPYHALIMRKY